MRDDRISIAGPFTERFTTAQRFEIWSDSCPCEQRHGVHVVVDDGAQDTLIEHILERASEQLRRALEKCPETAL
jgi:hypothetical protein